MDDAFRLISDLLGSEQRTLAAEKRADFLAYHLAEAEKDADQCRREASHDYALHVHEVHTLEKQVIALEWAKDEAASHLRTLASVAQDISERGTHMRLDGGDRALALSEAALDLAGNLDAADWVVLAADPSDAGAGWEVHSPDDLPEGRGVDDEREYSLPDVEHLRELAYGVRPPAR